MKKTLLSKLFSLTVVGTSVCLLAALVPQASAETSGSSPILNANSNDTLIDSDGISHGAWIGVSDASGSGNYQSRKTGSAYSIIDIDNYSNLSETYTVTNTSSSDKSLNAVLTLPQYNKALLKPGSPVVKVDPSRATLSASGFEFDSGSNASNITMMYSPAAGAYNSYASYKSANKIDDLMALQFLGTLKPGEGFTLTIPLSLTNPSTVDVTETAGLPAIYDYLYSPTTSNTALSFAFRHKSLDKSGKPALANTGSYFGATYDKKSNTYTAVPEYVQDAIAKQDVSDIKVDNFGIGQWTNASVDPVLYTLGRYEVNLQRIKDSVKNVGYSVAVNQTTLKELDSYVYTAAGTTQIVNADGSPAKLDQNGIGTIYVQLRPVIVPSGKDAVIQQGGSVKSVETVPVKEILNHSEQNVLPALNDVTIDTSKVDNTKPGRYPITYTYVPDGVSYTGYVRVEAAPVSVFTVAFDSQGGSSVSPQQIKAGDSAKAPAAPTRDGYTFSGWSTSKEGGSNVFNFDTPIVKDLTLYAQWKSKGATDTKTPPVTPGASGTPAQSATAGKAHLAKTGAAVDALAVAVASLAVLSAALITIKRRKMHTER